MSILDTWAADPRYQQLLSNPTYLQATPQFKQQVHDLLFNYGIQPTQQQQQDYGVGAVENNPYSVVAMLQKGHTQADHASINQLNAAGAEESGAAANAFNANNEAYKAKYSQALGQATGGLGQLLAGYTGQIGSIFDTLEQNPSLGTPSTQGLTPQSPIAQVYAPVGTSTPTTVHDEGPGAYAQAQATGLAAKLIKPVKPRVGPVLGGMGHIT